MLNSNSSGAYEAGILANSAFSSNPYVSSEAFRILEHSGQTYDPDLGFSSGGMLDYVDRFYENLEKASLEVPVFPSFLKNLPSQESRVPKADPSLEDLEDLSDDTLKEVINAIDPASSTNPTGIEDDSSSVAWSLSEAVRSVEEIENSVPQDTGDVQDAQDIEVFGHLEVPEEPEIKPKPVLAKPRKIEKIEKIEKIQEIQVSLKPDPKNITIRVQDAVDLSVKNSQNLSVESVDSLKKSPKIVETQIISEISGLSLKLKPKIPVPEIVKPPEIFLNFIDSGEISFIPEKNQEIPENSELQFLPVEGEDISFFRNLAGRLRSGDSIGGTEGIDSKKFSSLAIAVDLLVLYQICWETSVSYALEDHAELEDVWTSATSELFQIHALDMIWDVLGEESEVWEQVFGETRGAGLHSTAVRFGSDSIGEGENILDRLVAPAEKILNMVE